MFIKCCNKFHSTFFSFSRRTINPFIPEVKRTFQTFLNRVWRKKILSPPLFFLSKLQIIHISTSLEKEREKEISVDVPRGITFFQRKLLPDWMEQWQVGERQRSLAPYRKLYRKWRFRFSRTPIAAPLNIHRKGLQTTCCALVTKREARIRVR